MNSFLPSDLKIFTESPENRLIFNNFTKYRLESKQCWFHQSPLSVASASCWTDLFCFHDFLTVFKYGGCKQINTQLSENEITIICSFSAIKIVKMKFILFFYSLVCAGAVSQVNLL